MSTRVIINPSAGAGRGARRARGLRSLLESHWGDVEWVFSHSPGHVTALAREAALDGYDRVLIAGGDGSVHFAANGVAGTDTALGILPVGTGNDIATSAGLPRDMRAAAEILVQEHIYSMDVGRVGDRIFCCVLGVGMDTPALEVIERSPLRKGRLLYALAAVQTLVTYTPQAMRITCGNVRYEGDVTFVAVTNTPTYAGGIPIAPEARVEDGRLDLCVVPGGGPVRSLMTFGRVMGATHGDMPEIVLTQGESIRLESAAPMPITLDGELTELRTDVEISVWPGALKMLGSRRVAARQPAERRREEVA